MNKKILVISVALLAVAFFATPVMAIGPYQAFNVGNNKNLVPFGPALGNLRGGAGGSIYWIWIEADQLWVRWQFQDASQAKGLMKNAVVAQYSGPLSGMSAYFSSLSSEQYDNMWIYLSGDGGTNPSQFNGHGMLYWYVFGVSRLSGASAQEAAALATQIVTSYPQGEFWKHDDIFAPALP